MTGKVSLGKHGTRLMSRTLSHFVSLDPEEKLRLEALDERIDLLEHSMVEKKSLVNSGRNYSIA